MKQAEQKKVLNDFRSGAFNTLVATCIGEEGLDIPQVCCRVSSYGFFCLQRLMHTSEHTSCFCVWHCALADTTCCASAHLHLVVRLAVRMPSLQS